MITAVPDDEGPGHSSGHIDAHAPDPRALITSDPPRHGTMAAIPRLLIIEDNPRLCESMKEALSQDFEVQCAQGAREGVEAARFWTPDVAIVDLILPDGTGFEAAEELKRDAPGRLPVLMLTAAADWEERLDGNLPCDAVLTKPAHLAQIREVVERLIEPEPPAVA